MRFLLYLLAFIFFAAFLTFLFIILSIKKNIKWFTNPSQEGKFADFRGKKIFYRVKGKGEPVVFIINAIGSSQAEWWPIQNELSLKYRTITIDRPGYGWSSSNENSRTAADISEELDNIIKFERIKKPIYLVAHGTGTVYARHYAVTHTNNVVGMLFIDPLPIRYSNWLEAINENEDYPSPLEMIDKKKLKASKGYFRLFSPFKGYKLDSRYKRFISEHYTKTENYDAMKQEISQIESSISQIEAAGKFPPIPLRILYPANESLIRDWVKNGATEYCARQMGRLHHELSNDILALSPKSSVREVERSGEFIHLSKPDIVVQEILELIEG